MRYVLQLAAALPLLAGAGACAQITNPDALVAPPPRNPSEHKINRAKPDVYEWLYTRGWSAQPFPDKLLDYAPFNDLLDTELRAPQSMWGVGVPLADVARKFLSGNTSAEPALPEEVVVTGCVPEHCAERGLLWVNPRTQNPMLVFAALRWTEQSRTTDQPHAPFNLWIFPSRELDPGQLPKSFKSALSVWVNQNNCSATVSSVLLVEPNGIPHVLGVLDAGVQPTCAPTTTGTPQ